MLNKLGFSERLVALIMDCVTTVTYSVQVLGVPTRKIVPSRGLRQGDPLSPYLFLIGAEGLSTLLTSAQHAKRIWGVSIDQGAPTLSHLFFAGDNLLFCNAHLFDCSQHILRLYEQASGQHVNFDKSAICFSPNTDPIMKHLISSFLGVKIVDYHEKYLGLPTLARRNRSQMFSHVREMLWKKIAWMEFKAFVNCWKGSAHQSSCSSAAYLHNDSFSSAAKPPSRAIGYDCQVLVGKGRKERKLDELAEIMSTKMSWGPWFQEFFQQSNGSKASMAPFRELVLLGGKNFQGKVFSA